MVSMVESTHAPATATSTSTSTSTNTVAAAVAVDPLDAIRTQLDAFGAAYDYDVGYLHALLDSSPAGFQRFAAAREMSAFREALPRDAHFLARLGALREEDCGPCSRLNIKMALEAGVERALLRRALEAPTALPGPLADVWEHAVASSAGAPSDGARLERLRAAYGDAGVAELALVIAGARVYPALKRALGRDGACTIGSLAALLE